MKTEKLTEIDYYKIIVAKHFIKLATQLKELGIDGDLPYELDIKIDDKHPDVEKFISLHCKSPD